MQSVSTVDALPVVFAGIFCVLALASIVGWLLKVRFAAHKPHAVIDALNGRIEAWWAMAIFVGVAVWIGAAGIVVLFGFISFQCLREYISVTKTRISDHYALIWSFYFFLPAQYVLTGLNQEILFSVLIPVFAFLLLPMLSVLRGDTRHFLSRAAQVQWGLMICVYFLSHIPALMWLPVQQEGPSSYGSNALLIIFLMLVVQGSHVVQYTVDQLVGRHRVVSDISDIYTYEGLLARLASAAVIGAAMWWITPFSVWQAGLIALLLGWVGFSGKFILWAIKRDRGVKDWGLMNESHNGMLDVVDGISFAAPVFYYMVRYFWC